MPALVAVIALHCVSAAIKLTARGQAGYEKTKKPGLRPTAPPTHHWGAKTAVAQQRSL